MRSRALLHAVALVSLVGRLALAQTLGGATVRGVVYDSLGRAPLAGAIVQLVPAETLAVGTRFGATTTADSAGDFAFASVPDGRYLIGFFHPLLDSLGLAPPLQAVIVQGEHPTSVDLATPSPARLRTAICGAPKDTLPRALIVGTVRDARTGRALAGVRVTGGWVEFSLTPGGVLRRTPSIIATTGENGWFALCNVPAGGLMGLAASRGADSTDLLDLQVPPAGFLHRELYLGPARVSSHNSMPSIRVGDGRVSGTVVGAADGRPLSGATVAIAAGPRTRTNDRGEWTLAHAPEGTRMLEVRFVGYYPAWLPVDVAGGTPPVRIALPTLRSVLDTVKVLATPLNQRAVEFETRRRQGVGYFLTPVDVARSHPIETSDLFRVIPGFEIQYDGSSPERVIVSRRTHHFGNNGRCSPAIWINGVYFPRFSAEEIDGLVRPEELVGIEVYSEASVPPQYRPLGTRANDQGSCGSILIWTK